MKVTFPYKVDNTTPKVVLVIDDDPGTPSLIEAIFAAKKATSSEVIDLYGEIDIDRSNPEVDVLAWLERRKAKGEKLPDVIVCDQSFGDCDDLAKRAINACSLHPDKDIQKLRFIILTGNDRLGGHYKGHPILVKPVSNNHLFDTISQVACTAPGFP